MINSSIQSELDSRSVEDLLDSLSLDIMKDNIKQQIYEESDSRRDFLDTVLTKFRFIISNGDFDEDVRDTINGEINDFCNDIIDYIVGRYELMYEEQPSSILEVAETLYKFFVIQKESNVKEFFIRYIDENKQSIVDGLGLEKGTDVMSLASSHKTDDVNDIKIISNVDAVMNYIVSLRISTEEFLEILSCDGEYYASKFKDFVDSDILNGNFVSEYLTDVINDYDSIYSTNIRNELRMYFGLRNNE